MWGEVLDDKVPLVTFDEILRKIHNFGTVDKIIQETKNKEENFYKFLSQVYSYLEKYSSDKQKDQIL